MFQKLLPDTFYIISLEDKQTTQKCTSTETPLLSGGMRLTFRAHAEHIEIFLPGLGKTRGNAQMKIYTNV